MAKPSWKKALGVTKTKRKIAKATGIPTTKGGRKKKVNRMLTGGAAESDEDADSLGCGCLFIIAIGIFLYFYFSGQ